MATIRELLTVIKFQLTGAKEAQSAIAGIKRELASLKDTVINVRVRRTEEGGGGRRSGGSSTDEVREATNRRLRGSGHYLDLDGQLRDASGAVGNLSARSREAGQALSETGERGAAAATRIHEGMTRANEGAMRFRETMSGLIGILGAEVGMHEFVEMTNDWAAMSATIKIATKSQDEFVASRQRVVDISRANRVGFEGTSQLFANFKAAQGDTGETNEQIFNNIDTISKALAIGHQSNARNMAATRQFDDFLMLGKIQQRHLNSLKIDSPTLARAMEQAAGGPEELEKFMKGPENNLKGIIGLLQKMKPLVDANFKDLPLTFGNAMQRIRDDIEEIFGKLFVDSGAISDALTPIVGVFDWLVGATDRAAKALGGYRNMVMLIGDFVLAFLATAIARTAVWAAELVIAELPWIVLAAAIAAVGLAIQDVWVWMRGGESVTGRLIGSFKEWKPEVDKLRAAVSELWTKFLHPAIHAYISFVSSTLATILGHLGLIHSTAGQPFKWAAKDVFDAALGTIHLIEAAITRIMSGAHAVRTFVNDLRGEGDPNSQSFAARVGNAGRSFINGASGMLGLGSVTPKVGANSLTAGNSYVNTHAPVMNNNITNNITATSSAPAAVAAAASQGTSQGVTTSLGSSMRSFKQSFAPAAEAGVAY